MGFVENIEKIPNSDLYIAKLFPNTNFNGSHFLNCGRNDTDLNSYRTLMYFDLSNLPENIMICEASLNLYINLNQNTSVTKPLIIHKLLEPFNENLVTYSTEPKFKDTPYTSLNISNEINKFIKINITSLVGEWYCNPSLNYGIVIKSFEDKSSFVSFSSTFSDDETKFPQLELRFKYCPGLSSYPMETINLLSSDDSATCTPVYLGPNIGTFAMENKGNGAITVLIQLSSDNINWIDNKLPYASDYILLKDDNIILTTTAYMNYARVFITHANNHPIEDATIILYKTIKV
ncbi:DNRLRE domain-containing protein [Clostridium rectalis]|uniref:DNRLRE domain-containing protein n=1 Tax=Clostridium rectalis TaxID=2040295 RepID=UPI000F63F6DA|nr:DNRLRE domain-containing protein [Clostridium rectalis]